MSPTGVSNSFAVFAPVLALWLSAILASRHPSSERLADWLSLAGASGSLLIALRLWSGPRLEAPIGFSANSSSVALMVIVCACIVLYFLSRLDAAPSTGPNGSRQVTAGMICLFGGFVLLLVLSRDLFWMLVFSELMAWSFAWHMSRAFPLGGDERSGAIGVDQSGQLEMPLLAVSGVCLFMAVLALSVFSGGTDLSLVGERIGTLSSIRSGFVEIGSFAFVAGLFLRAVWYLRRFLRHRGVDLSTACLGVGLVLLVTAAVLAQWWVWIGASNADWQGLVCGLGGLAIFWGGLSSIWRYDIRAWLRSAAGAQLGVYLLVIGSGADGLLGLEFMFTSSPVWFLALGVAFDVESDGPNGFCRKDRLRAPWLYGLALASLASLPPSSGFLAKFLVGGALMAELPSVPPFAWSSVFIVGVGLGLLALAVSALRLMSRTLTAETGSTRDGGGRLGVAVMTLVLVVSSIWPQPWLSWAARAASSAF